MLRRASLLVLAKSIYYITSKGYNYYHLWVVALVEPLIVVEVFAVESVVDTVFVVAAAAAVVVLSASSSFEIVVVFPLGTAVDLYAVVVVAFSCSTGRAMGANVSFFMSCSFCSLMKLNCKQLQNDLLP